MRAFFSNNIWLVIFVVVVMLHLLSVIQPLITTGFTARVQNNSSSLAISGRSHQFNEEQASNFSGLFGIEAISFVTEIGETEPEQAAPEIKLLNAYQPVLIAIDEIENTHTARLLLTDENQNKLTSVRLGEVLHGYKAITISLNTITFELNESHDQANLPATIALTIFSRNNLNAN